MITKQTPKKAGRALFIGTTSWDIVRVTDLKKEKPSCPGYDQVGGVGFNAAYVSDFLCDVFGVQTSTTLASQLGSDHDDNNYKPIVEKNVQNLTPNIRILNTAPNDETVKTPVIPVIVHPEGKWRKALILSRGLLQSAIKKVFEASAQNTRKNNRILKEKPIASDICQALHEKGAQADVIILTSRMTEASLAAIENTEATVVLDLNFETHLFTDDIERIIKRADYIFAPREAADDIPDVKAFYQSDLVKFLTDAMGKDHVAVSDGIKPVEISSARSRSEFTIIVDNKPKDTLGCGDARTGAFAFTCLLEKAYGIEIPFETKTAFATDFSTFTAQFYGRNWAMPEYLNKITSIAKKHNIPLNTIMTSQIAPDENAGVIAPPS